MEPMEDASTVERTLLRRAAQRRVPLNGSLELTPLCNMHCDMCYVRLRPEEMRRQGRLRTAEEWLSVGQEMQKSGVLFLLLTGGEPLLHPGFRDIYLGLFRMGMILTVNTNGTLLDQDLADFFAENKPRRINITLYGADNSAYAELCHYPGGYDRTVRAIRLLNERGIAVKINGSVTKRNVSDMDAIYDLARELDVPVHMDTYMLPGLSERGKPFLEQARLAPAEAAHAELHALKKELTQESFHQYVCEMLRQVHSEGEQAAYPRHISCMAGSCSFTINWNGEMRPCVTLPYPSVPVFERGFPAAWQEITAHAKELTLDERCARCTYRPICKVCVSSALLETGQCDGVPLYSCEYAAEFLRLLELEERNG